MDNTARQNAIARQFALRRDAGDAARAIMLSTHTTPDHIAQLEQLAADIRYCNELLVELGALPADAI